MTSELSDDLVRHWVTGWARTHDYDVHHEGNVHSALRSGDSDEWEYVLYSPQDTDLRKIASAVSKDSARLLTVIAEPGAESLSQSPIEGLQLISDEERLMVVDMDTQDVEDPITPEGYTTTREDHDGWTLFTVRDGDKVAARGRVATVGHYAILDRIYTNDDYRRQGLGTYVTRALIAIAHEHDVEEGLLVATGDGRELYEYLGWTLLGDVHVYGATSGGRLRPSHSQFDDLND
ncbi:MULTISPECIES: GNAT family N-acetyltransferase [unclassified Nesterenkonia]|uniref:GNAT family N-acetyltransferase n=1 Tax=unclassified Nesterenkonia TaxID=2629769 RepID=UPI001F4CE588|nr:MULTISPECIES: GNAT family N-acetyltransferase [unclassified Nesterenkonia]MCH8561509.1 GNAT family N-acetyltransferase [Nesterenkonia sp. DZ6]MCH8563991.1 GNAT family N-acetyltransferase [Nesterenkonia sp. YGD6]